jgi:hypothetical protein
LAKFNKVDVPWVHLIWSSYYTSKLPHLVSPKGLLNLSNIFRVATCTAGIGDTVSLWEDNYLDQTLAMKFPVLLTYARPSALSLQKGCQAANFLDL